MVASPVSGVVVGKTMALDTVGWLDTRHNHSVLDTMLDRVNRLDSVMADLMADLLNGVYWLNAMLAGVAMLTGVTRLDSVLDRVGGLAAILFTLNDISRLKTVVDAVVDRQYTLLYIVNWLDAVLRWVNWLDAVPNSVALLGSVTGLIVGIHL